MKRELRDQLLIAATSNVQIDRPEHSRLTAHVVNEYLEELEVLDDIHELKYEREIVRNVHEIIADALKEPRLREILPAVLTFQAMAKTGATSSIIVHLQAQLQETYKKINGPAALTKADGEALLEQFARVLPKYDAEIAELEAKAKL